MAAAVLSLGFLLWPAPSAAKAPPPGFFGVVPQGPLGAGDYDRMRGAIGTLRVPIYWYRVEPRPGEYDFAELDALVGEAAERGIRVLPFVYGSPSWATGGEARPPLAAEDRGSWARLLRRLVRRYGPLGEFWHGRPRRLPIRSWQIWNEPNFRLFWRPRPEPLVYAGLLRLSARVLRGVDPGATVLAAGVAPVEAGITPWAFLRRMYEAPGVRGDFDLVALHPYAPHVAWVARQIGFVRDVMADAGDGNVPLQITELGIASSSAFSNPFDKGLSGQADFLRRSLRLILRNRLRWRISGLDWFTWRDAPVADPHCVFCQYGGLFDSTGAPKPAWWALRRLASRRHSGF